MDEPISNEESPNQEASPANHLENVEDAQSHSVSPERPVAENENAASPATNEAVLNRHLLNAEDAENGNRPINKDSVPDCFLDPEEVMMQRRALLNAAIASQGNESVFSCKYPGCNFTSTDVEMYLKHEDTHVEGGPVDCDVCNQRFPTYACMRRHRLVHLGVRPFECQTCMKRFLRKEQFMEHVLRHSKQRLFRCPFCNRGFNFRLHLKMHLTTDHPNIVIDKTCHMCDYKSSSPNGAKVHFAMCHLKHIGDASETGDRSHEVSGSSQAHVTPTENGAIDLATVSQNFSFVQAAHYSPYTASVSDSTAVVPGPSDLSHPSKAHITATVSGHRAFIPHSVEQNIVMAVPDEDNRHTCISALAGSTAVVSPLRCQDRTCCRPSQHHEAPTKERVCIKPEPPELAVDDSQNSNVQPTSTMDLSTVDVVETTCVSNEASGSNEIPCRRKTHKHSSSDETGSESHNSPPSRALDSQNASQSSRTVHTCYRLRSCEENQPSRNFSKHTCISHRHLPEKRPRLSESDGDRNNNTDLSDSEERKVFYNRATSTNSLNQTGIPMPRVVYTTSLHNDSSVTTVPPTNSNYCGQKNTICIRDIESCTLTCPYCGIIFPDQTLYLLHRSLHSESSPWKCNLCGKNCKDKYDFNSHIISKGHY